MKHSFYHLLIILTILLSTTIRSQNALKLRVDPSKAYGGNASEYFEHIEYIPLETKKESLFGIISRLIITDSSYIVQDRDTRSVLFFDLTGKYITKLKYGNHGIYIYPQLNDKLITIFEFERNSEKVNNQQYSLKGNRISDNRAITVNSTANLLENGYYSILNDCYSINPDTIKSVVSLVSVFTKESLLYNGFLQIPIEEFKSKCRLLSDRLYATSADESSNFHIVDFDFNIYKASKDSIHKLFEIVFPSMRTLSKELLERKYSDNSYAKTEFARKHPKAIRAITNIRLENDLLFFKIMPWEYNLTESTQDGFQYNLILNIKTKRLVSFERLTSDDMAHYLPISDGFHTSYYGISFFRNFLYSSVSSIRMFSAKESTKHRNPQYPPVLQKYFKEENRKSNPVIVRMKLRE